MTTPMRRRRNTPTRGRRKIAMVMTNRGLDKRYERVHTIPLVKWVIR